jgi:predicted amidohydrolase
VHANSDACFPGGEHRRDLHCASRALDNGSYVVFSGSIGAPYDFIGGTAAYSFQRVLRTNFVGRDMAAILLLVRRGLG